MGRAAYTVIWNRSSTAMWAVPRQECAMSEASRKRPRSRGDMPAPTAPPTLSGVRSSKLFTSRTPHSHCTSSESLSVIARPNLRKTCAAYCTFYIYLCIVLFFFMELKYCMCVSKKRNNLQRTLYTLLISITACLLFTLFTEALILPFPKVSSINQ